MQIKNKITIIFKLIIFINRKIFKKKIKIINMKILKKKINKIAKIIMISIKKMKIKYKMI